MSTAHRLYCVYERLAETVPTGPVHHGALTDGYELRMGTSDFGDLSFSVRTPTWLKIWHYVDQTDRWEPATVKTTERDLDAYVEMAEEAEWQDQLKR